MKRNIKSKLLSLVLALAMIICVMPSFVQNVDADKGYVVKIDSSITNGTVTGGDGTHQGGDKITLTVTPNAGYKLKELKVNVPEEIDEISDIVGLMGDATFEELDGNGLLKITDGKFTVYHNAEIYAQLDSSTKLTIENNTFTASSNNFEWTFVCYDEDIDHVKLYNKNSYDLYYFSVDGNNTGSLPDGDSVNTTKVEEGKYTFTMPESYVRVRATFEEEPISVKVDVGAGHASLFTDDVLNYIKDEYELDDVTISGNVITLIGVNPDKTENQLNYLIWGVLDDLTDDTDGIHNGEYFYDVGYKPFDKYATYEDFVNDVYDERAHEAKVQDGLTLYLLWQKPLEKLELSIDNPVDGQEPEDVTLTAPYGINIDGTHWYKGENYDDEIEIFESGEEYTCHIYPVIEEDGVLWKYFIDEDNIKVSVDGGEDVQKVEDKEFCISFKVTADPIAYKNIEGDGSTWEIGSGKTLSFRFKRNWKDDMTYTQFDGILIDNKFVDSSNYSAIEGSVIIELQSSYLETLSAGQHELTAKFKDGKTATAKFTITKKSNPPYIPPKTGVE